MFTRSSPGLRELKHSGRDKIADIFPMKFSYIYIFLNQNVGLSINILLNFDLKGQITNIPTLVQTVAWRRPYDKPLSEPMPVYLLSHICVTRPQRVKCLLSLEVCDKPLSKPMPVCLLPHICVNRPQRVKCLLTLEVWLL